VTKNRRVSLYIYSKVGDGWKYRKAPERPKNLPEGSAYVIMWYEGEDADGKHRKRSLNVGRLADVAKVEITKKKAALLNRIVEGKDTPEPEPTPAAPLDSPQFITDAVKNYLQDCEDRIGNSGYGFSKRTLVSYRRHLAYLTDFAPATSLADMDEAFFKKYRRWLREHPNKFSDRTCHNILLTANTLARVNGNEKGKKILAEMSFPPKPCRVYTDEELEKFFSSCSPDEALIYKFFLHSMGREQEVANTEVQDFNFKSNVLHICPKLDRGFRLKSQKGQAALGRYVPIPASLMRKLQEHCKGKRERDLVFPNAGGGVEGHFLRKCQRIAKCAGLTGFELHAFRKTGATKLHRAGAKIRDISAWLGHKDTKTTQIYLGVSDAADEACQTFVNNTPLAAMFG